MTDQVCCYCAEEYTEVCQLSCGHCFHSSCIHEWRIYCSFCPLCRTDAVCVNEHTPATTSVLMERYLTTAQTQHASIKEMEEHIAHLRDTVLQLYTELKETASEVRELTRHVESQQILLVLCSEYTS
jgi:hypothetical protein